MQSSQAVFELPAATLVICECQPQFNQSVSCENQAVSRESYQSALYQVCIISLHCFKSTCKIKQKQLGNIIYSNYDIHLIRLTVM